VLVTEWHLYRRHPDFERIGKLLKTRTLFDGRNVWQPAEARAAGFVYAGIGRP
jgi:UDPglucose 6-dehydrogenase